MSSNPEFQRPENTKIEPETQASIDAANAPYQESIDQHHTHDSTVDTGQIQHVLENPDILPDGRRPAPELPAAKKSKLGKWLIAGVSAGAVFAASTAVTVNAITSGITNSQDKDLPPAPNTNNTAPVVPGQTPTTPENRGGLGEDTYKFYSADGKSFQTFEQLSESINIPVAENKGRIEAMTTYYKQMEKMANYFPSEQEVRNNLNIPTGQLTADDYMDACKLYHSAFDGLYEKPTGKLYNYMRDLAAKVAYVKLETLNDGDAVPYNVTIDFAQSADKFIVGDNAAQNSVDDINTISGEYNISFTGFGPNQTTDKNPVWLVDGNIQVAKAGTK